MKMQIYLFLLMLFCQYSYSFSLISLSSKFIKNYNHIHKMSTSNELSDDVTIKATDLTGYGMLCTFNGLGVEAMTCTLEFKKNSEVIFGNGLESSKPGVWRVIRYNDGKEEVEVVHPLLPEHMFFLDLWENTLLWRGTLDLNNQKVTNGEMITNKKRLGLIPYKDTIGTFEAKLYSPKEKLPTFYIPKFSDQRFLPPEDFSDPRDMKRYPQYFDQDYQDWWFAVEDAMARGETPSPRPKAFFTSPPSIDPSDKNNIGRPNNYSDENTDSSVSTGKKELRDSIKTTKSSNNNSNIKRKGGGFSNINTSDNNE